MFKKIFIDIFFTKLSVQSAGEKFSEKCNTYKQGVSLIETFMKKKMIKVCFNEILKNIKTFNDPNMPSNLELLLDYLDEDYIPIKSQSFIYCSKCKESLKLEKKINNISPKCFEKKEIPHHTLSILDQIKEIANRNNFNFNQKQSLIYNKILEQEKFFVFYNK